MKNLLRIIAPILLLAFSLMVSAPSYGQSAPMISQRPSNMAATCNSGIRGSLNNWIDRKGGLTLTGAGVSRSTLSNARALEILDSLLVNECNDNLLVVTSGFFATSGTIGTTSTDTIFVNFTFSDDATIPSDTIAPQNLRLVCNGDPKLQMIDWVRSGGNGSISDGCRGVMPWTRYSWTSTSNSGGGSNDDASSFDNIIDNTTCVQVIDFTFFANNGCDAEVSQTASLELFFDSTSISIDSLPRDLVLDCSDQIQDKISSWFINDRAGFRVSSAVSTTIVNSSIRLDSILDRSADFRQTGCNDYSIDFSFSVSDTLGMTAGPFPVTIQVVDTIGPTITSTATDLQLECNVPNIADTLTQWIMSHGGAIAVDNCSDSVIWTRFSWTGQGQGGNGDFENGPFNNIIDNNNCSQIYNFIFETEDLCGNATQATVSFEIIDTAFIIESTARDFSLGCNEFQEASLITWYNQSATFRASLAGESLASLSTKTLDEVQNEFDASFMDGCGEGFVTAGFYALSDEGNSTDTAMASFFTVDTIGPIVQNTPSNISFDCTEVDSVAVAQWLLSQGGATASDACSDSTFWTEFIWISSNNDTSGGNFMDGPFTVIDGFDCFESATVTFVVSDPCGNTSTTRAIFSIQDTTSLMDSIAPIITQNPQNINVDCNVNILDTLASWYNEAGGLLATDENNVIKLRATRSFALVQQDFNASNTQSNCASGNVMVGFFALDTLDNSSDTIFANFTAVDSLPPNIITPAQNLTITCNVGRQDSLTNWIKRFGGAVARDECSEDDVIWAQFSYLDSDSTERQGTFQNGPFDFIGTELCNWSVDINFFVTDACGNLTTTSATFTIKDEEAPVFPFILRDTTLNCDNVPSATAIIADDVCEGQIMATAVDSTTQSEDQTSCGFFNYVIFRTYSASDACGNGNSFTQIITISDTLEPRYEAPADITISCLDDFNPDRTGRPINVIDNCASEVDITFTDSQSGEGCERQIIRNWNIKDLCGSSLILSQTITIRDTIAPVLLTEASDTTINCTNAQDLDQQFSLWIANFGGATASDDCGADIIAFAAVSGSYDINDVSTFPGRTPTMIDLMSCPSTGSGTFIGHSVDFVFVDDCDNASVSTAKFIVVDDIPPVISGTFKDTVLTIPNREDCSLDILIPALTVADACGNLDNEFSMNFRQDISSSELGNEQIPVDSFTARFGPVDPDVFNADESVTLMVQMINIDADDPTEFFNIVGEDGSDLGRTPLTPSQCGDAEFSLTFTPAQINAWLADGFIDINFYPNIPAGLGGALAINDVCFGGGTRILFSLDIDLEVKGFIDYKIQIDDNTPVTLDGVQDYTATIEAGTHQITYLVADCSGNQSSLSYEVMVKEETPPSISCPADVVISVEDGSCGEDFILPNAVSITDNCNLSDTISYSVSGATVIGEVYFNPNEETTTQLSQGINILQYTAYDGSGNSATCAFNVTVEDSEAPVIMCRDTSIAQTHPSGLLPLIVDPAFVLASANDNCEIADYQYTNTDFTCSDIDSIVTIGVIVADKAGNTSQCVSNVRIVPYVLEPIAQSLVCTGDSLMLNANVPTIDTVGVYVFNWSGPNGFSSNLENPVIPNSTPELSGMYNLVVLGANGCRSIGFVNVLIQDFNMPMLSVDKDSICAGDSIILTGTNYESTVTYKWFAGTAPSGEQIGETAEPTFTYTPTEDQESFYLIAENEACETTPSGQVNVKVNPLPDLDITPITVQVCEKGSFSLQANYEGSDITQYRWTGPRGFTSDMANPPAFDNVTLDQAGEYILEIIENGCPSPQKVTTIVIQPFPVTPEVKVDPVICEGGNLILSLADTSAGGGTLNWLLDGEFYEAVDGNGLIIQNVTDSVQGLWQVYTQNGACISDTSSGVIVAIEKNIEINIFNDTLQCEGDEVVLMSNVLPDATYEWSGPNNFRSTEEQPSVIITEGTYSLTVRTAAGCQNVAAFDVTTTPLPMILDVSENNLSECVDGSNTIIVTTSVGPDSNYVYSWTGPNGFVSDNDSLIIINATAEMSGTYSLIIENDICQSAPRDITVTLTGIPEAPSLGDNITACVGEPLTLSIEEPQEGIDNYLWTTPMGMFETDEPTFSIPEIAISNAGIYSVDANRNGCMSTGSDLLTVNVFGIPRAPSLSGNGPICEGEDLILQATQILDAEYIWTGPNGFASDGDRVVIRNTTQENEGDYSVQIVLNGCASLPTTLSDVEFLPRPDKPITELTRIDVCQDDMNGSTMLCINSPQYNPDGVYIWTNLTTDSILGRTSDRCLVLSMESANIVGENRIIVEEINDICTSEASDVISFVIFESLESIADGGPDVIACNLANVALDASNPERGTGRWRAIDPDINFSDPTDPKSLVFDINEGENVLIWQLENGACQGDTDTIIVSTEFALVANDDAFQTAYNTPITFTPEINDDFPDNFDINIISQPKSGRVTSTADGLEFIPENGFLGPVEVVYEICSALCPNNCDRATITIDVGDVSDCFAPSLITPNGDGINDAFVIPCIESGLYPSNQLYIYNQYGDQVLDAPSYNNDWKGQYNGKDLPTGTYYYVFRANNQLSPEKGFIIIER